MYIQCIIFSVLHGVVLHPSVQLHMIHLNNNIIIIIIIIIIIRGAKNTIYIYKIK